MCSALNHEWCANYDVTKRSLLTRRASGVAIGKDDVNAYLSSIAQLDASLRVLASAQQEHEMSPAEVVRRQTLIDNLRKKCKALPNVTSSSSSGSSSSSSSSSGSSSSSSSGTGGSSYSPLATSDHGLVLRARDMTSIQNDMIVDIGAGVDRLREQALLMSNETALQNLLISDLEDGVELATHALLNESRRAELLKQRTNAYRAYMCIALEVFLIFVLLIAWASK